MKNTRQLLFTLAVVALAQGLPAVALAQAVESPQQWQGMGPWHMMYGGWGFGWLMPLMMLVVVIVCAFYLMRRPSSHGPTHGVDPHSSALQVLNERLAKGEIQTAEYEEKKAAILRRS